MKRRNYIFTNKKHSQRAMMSAILGSISLIGMLAAVYMAYLAEGQGEYGMTGLLATVFSLVGLVLGVVTVREKSYYRFFPWLGVVLNLAVLAGMSFILYLGNML